MLSGSSFEVEEYWMSSDNFSKFFVAACFFVGCFSAFFLLFFCLLVLKMTVLYYSNTFLWKDENYKPFSPYPYRLKYFLYKKSIWTNRPALYYTTPRTSLKIKTLRSCPTQTILGFYDSLYVKNSRCKTNGKWIFVGMIR